MDMLNYRDFSKKFPVCPKGESSDQAWASLLLQWRGKGKLELKRHWRYGPSIDGNNQPTRYYDVPRVVRLVCLEARSPTPRPRIAYLNTEYYDDFSAILAEANAAKATNAEQVITS
jgi:hypothetical protein